MNQDPDNKPSHLILWLIAILVIFGAIAAMMYIEKIGEDRMGDSPAPHDAAEK